MYPRRRRLSDKCGSTRSIGAAGEARTARTPPYYIMLHVCLGKLMPDFIYKQTHDAGQNGTTSHCVWRRAGKAAGAHLPQTEISCRKQHAHQALAGVRSPGSAPPQAAQPTRKLHTTARPAERHRPETALPFLVEPAGRTTSKRRKAMQQKQLLRALDSSRRSSSPSKAAPAGEVQRKHNSYGFCTGCTGCACCGAKTSQ